jgi:hypothetical protein
MRLRHCTLSPQPLEALGGSDRPSGLQLHDLSPPPQQAAASGGARASTLAPLLLSQGESTGSAA